MPARGDRAARPHRPPPARAEPAAARVHPRRAPAREPPRPHRLRRDACCWSPASAGLRLPARRGVGACTSPGAATTARSPSAPAAACAARRRRAAAARRGAARRRASRTRARGSTASYGAGLDALSAPLPRATCAARPAAPASPRPVDAQHLGGRLLRPRPGPADARSPTPRPTVGVERFVLDDGWFRRPARRPGRASATGTSTRSVWPDGLHPLVDHVRGLGMQFGLWVEPEMVNPDSDLARAHPDWILAAGGRLPAGAAPAGARPGAPGGLRLHPASGSTRCSTEYAIAYLKWDHNRDLVEAGTSRRARRRARRRPLAVYRLIDELQAPPPRPGDRVVLVRRRPRRPRRSWSAPTGSGPATASTPLERQQIQRWTGAARAAGADRRARRRARRRTPPAARHALDFRAGTALFGHFGIEWDLDAADRRGARAARRVGRRCTRSCGRCCTPAPWSRADHPDPACGARRRAPRTAPEAVYALVATVDTSVQAPAGLVRLPGLDPEARYHLAPLPPGDLAEARRPGRPLPWWSTGVTLPGGVLGRAACRRRCSIRSGWSCSRRRGSRQPWCTMRRSVRHTRG